MPDSVFIAGPASWNTIVVLDRLPEPVPHMQFAEETWATVGGTSAGKALSLTGLGRATRLHALAGRDAEGERVRAALHAAGVRVHWGEGVTERHLNLMTRAGERVSLYLSSPDATAGEDDVWVRERMGEAGAIVLDLAAEPLRLLPMARETGVPIWVDVHDYDGEAEFHRPFLAAADAVFCNADRLSDPVAFLRARIAAGASPRCARSGPRGRWPWMPRGSNIGWLPCPSRSSTLTARATPSSRVCSMRAWTGRESVRHSRRAPGQPRPCSVRDTCIRCWMRSWTRGSDAQGESGARNSSVSRVTSSCISSVEIVGVPSPACGP